VNCRRTSSSIRTTISVERLARRVDELPNFARFLRAVRHDARAICCIVRIETARRLLEENSETLVP
jgi:hypothetical protein